MNYHYEPWVYEEILRVSRGLFRPGIPLKQVSRQADLGGIDAEYCVNHSCPLALRARFNRPPGAADCDITFRTTEPSMMAGGTYAPLALFVWFVEHHIVAAKLVDIERMYLRLNPPFSQRPATSNGDGTGFYCVDITELHAARALLRLYDGQVWATAILGGELRLDQILAKYRH